MAKVLEPDKYGRSVTLEDGDASIDIYIIDDAFKLQFKKGTPLDTVYNTINSMPSEGDVEVVSLPSAIKTKIDAFEDALQAWTDEKYSPNLKFNFLVLFTIANLTGRLNQQAYIQQLFTWGASILDYNVKFVQQVSSLKDYKEVAAFNWDFEKNIMKDPQVSLFDAAQIPD